MPSSEARPSSDSSEAREPTSSSSALCFEQLRVGRFNGIEHGLEVDLCDGVNVIHGSNAAGKTTLAHAVHGLLWPEHVEDQLPIVEGRFTFDGSAWRVELEGSRCSYVRDQSPASRPPLSPSSHGPRYHIYLHDLLRDEAEEGSFAQSILKEAQGGIDVEAAAEALGFDVPNRRTAQITTTVETLREERDATRDAQERLRRREQKLARLREKKAEAEEAARRAAALEQALEVAAARRACDEAEAALDAFPDVMSEVEGTEGDRLDALKGDLREADREIQRAEDEIRQARATIEESRIPGGGLPDGRVEELRQRVSTLREQERDVRKRRARVAEAETKERDAWGRLPGEGDKGAAAGVDLPDLEKIESHVKAAEDFYGHRQAFETARELFDTGGPDASIDALQDGLKHLHRWLQVPRPDATSEPEWLRWTILAGGILVIGGGAYLAGAGLSPLVGAALALLGLAIAAVEGWRWAQGNDRGSAQRSLHEKEYQRLGIGGPARWSRGAVEEHADVLLGRLREAHVSAQKRDTWEQLQANYDTLDSVEEKLDRERRRLAEDLGVDLDAGSLSLPVLLERLARWQAAYDDLKAEKAALEEAHEGVERCRRRLSRGLAEYDLGPVGDASDGEGAVQTLETARDEFRKARRDLEHARARKENAAQDRGETQSKIEALYQTLDLEPGEEEALRRLAGRHEAYQEALDEKRQAEATLKAELRQLRRKDAYEEGMEDATTEELEQQLGAARETAQEREEHARQINRIERDVESAREGGTLEERQATYRERRDDLAAERERDYEKAVGKVLADFVQGETRDQGLPPVFHRARELFAEITGYRYELKLDREHGTFRALDHTYGKTFALGELSSGTRVQLMLSVRIAFLETQEQACRAPLVLDETLANSDDSRAGAIISAIQTICEKGRQVLYLTAQADEVRKWAARLNGEDGPSCSVISLEEPDARDLLSARGGAGEEASAVPARRVPEALPDPEETTHAELQAELDVPDWSPREPVGRLHLWYLVESPRRLVDLIGSGTRTWGHLQTRHRIGGVGATPFDERAMKRVQARARAVEVWKEAWHVGRGRPVGRPALEKTDAVTDNYIDAVAEIARELGGDAKALLDVLRRREDDRVSGFRSHKADALEAYFLEKGYHTTRDPLSKEDMWQKVLANLTEERSRGLISEEALDRLFQRIGAVVGGA